MAHGEPEQSLLVGPVPCRNSRGGSPSSHLSPIISNRHLGVLQLGHETASGLGLRVPPSQRLVLLAASALAAAATASAGPVLFVALVAPGRCARRMAQTTNTTLGTAGLVGAALMCTADLIGRVIPFTNDLPVGILTGILVSYLLWYLARSNTAWGIRRSSWHPMRRRSP